ncbi:MAG: glycosyltransferase [Anaerolineae bacterium]|nr:glycosyltransferase [Anaerolineae bacterium]
MNNSSLKQDVQIAEATLEQKMPKVSIVTPNYNHAQYVGDAIRSVLAQDYQDFEMLVIDDGSTDNSREVVTQFTDDRIKYIWQKNQGLSAARNTGIKIAKGEMIALLDADDMYETNFLSTLVSILEANPNLDGVYCGYQFVDHLNQPLFQREARSIGPDQLYTYLIDGNFLVPESMLAYRYCYHAVGPYDETLRACEDWDIWLKITHKYQIGGTNRILTRHRVLPGSMSTDPIRMLNNRLTVITKHFGPEPSQITTDTSRQGHIYAQAYLATAIEYLQYQDLNQAYDCLYKAVVLSPDLLKNPGTFYELGFGDQPKGSRGNFATLNLSRNASILIDMLDKLFKDSHLAPTLQEQKREIYGTMYLVLGILSHRKQDFSKARSYLLKSIMLNPSQVFNHQLVRTFIKSLPGVHSIVNLFKKTD